MSSDKIAAIITPERYSTGDTYEGYLNGSGENRERFQEFENSFKLSSEDESFFKKLKEKKGALKALAIGEAWSPDVHRALPVLNKIAQAGGMELRIFSRDNNPDIMDIFLNRGEFRSIPTFAFFSPDLRYLCHWIERPAAATKLYEEIDAELSPQNLPVEERRKIRRQRTRHLWPGWQVETIKEIRGLLS